MALPCHLSSLLGAGHELLGARPGVHILFPAHPIGDAGGQTNRRTLRKRFLAPRIAAFLIPGRTRQSLRRGHGIISSAMGRGELGDGQSNLI